MSDTQKEAMRLFTGARVFNAINPIFESLPERFTTGEVMAKARLKGQGSMCTAIRVLERSFHCSRNAAGIWRKHA